MLQSQGPLLALCGLAVLFSLAAPNFGSLANLVAILEASAIPAVIAGEIDMLFSTPVSTMPLVRAGKLRALATTGLKRSRATPSTG